MLEKKENILRTFRIERDTMESLSNFMEEHPEVGSMNHLVGEALKEFAVRHRGDPTWLKIERSKKSSNGQKA